MWLDSVEGSAVLESGIFFGRGGSCKENVSLQGTVSLKTTRILGNEL
jgi:hypothetical protein